MKKIFVFMFLFAMVYGLWSMDCFCEEQGLAGYWKFDNDLSDASGAGNDAKGGGAEFIEGRKDMALKLRNQRITIPSRPELNLAPGLCIDCWVYFDKKPDGYPQMVFKDKEYQIRVDSESEGGKFRFFVFLDNAWEPRVGDIVPEPGKWYHLVAKWTGTEMSLEINGEKYSSPRTGMPVPTNNPVYVGYMFGRQDELKISNPNLAKTREIRALMEKVPDSSKRSRAVFGKKEGWEGWQAGWGAKMTAGPDGGLTAKFPGPDAMVFCPSLDADAGKNKYISIDIESAAAENANLFFITTKGQGIATFPVWGNNRTSIINMSSNPLWSGRLQFLGVFFIDGKDNLTIMRNLWVSDRIEGSPFIYARSVSPGRAVLRAGREEKVIAVINSLGFEAKNIEAKLLVPAGVKILDESVRKIPSLGYDKIQMVEWKVSAEKPGPCKLKVALSADNFKPAETGLDLDFTPPLKLPKADYVPEPVPAKSKYIMLMHYCPLWKAGTHYGWGKIEPWPERRPAIGWYDEGTPEVADWHIKYAVEHGIQAFIYCWYRKDFSPEITQSLGHAIHDGMLKAKYLDKFKFVIMWENGCACGVKSREDMMDNLLPYWIKTYFKHPSYLIVDNKPVLFVWRPERVSPELGGSEKTKAVFIEMREECKKQGFDGLYIIGCVGGADKELLERMAKEGWDASSAYGTGGPSPGKPSRDPEGISTVESNLEGLKQTWTGKKKIGALPDIVDVMIGWDPRPWHGKATGSYQINTTPERFRTACMDAKKIIDSTPGSGLDKRIVVFDNWNEFGEGHYIEPCSGFGFSFVDVIREVFCEPGPHTDIIPEDVGLETPDRIHRILKGEVKTEAKAKAGNSLLAYWTFDKGDSQFIMDSSGTGLHLIKQGGFELAEGFKGKGFLCKGGSASTGPTDSLFPSTGMTIELWFKTNVPNQSDKWFINTVSAANTGYRLGMIGGRVSFQVPQTSWSHLISCPAQAELGKWIFVAATYDNKTMKIFIDGELKASLDRAGEIVSSGAGACVGNYMPEHNRAFFEGTLDEMKIYSRALSAAEITEHARR